MSRYGEGSIDQRGENSFRLRYTVDGTRYAVAFRGSLSAAKKELRRLLSDGDKGTHVAPDKTTVGDYLTAWLDTETDLSPKTRERYRQLAARQIIPHLGTVPLQALKPAQVDAWHKTLLNTGLAARTVGHAHRLLHRVLVEAVRLEVLSRNVASGISPPKVDAAEVEILSPGQVTEVRAQLAGHPLSPIVELALGTGMRRGEICGLAWGAVDLDKVVIRVERSLEDTAAGLRIKPPKSAAGRRTISLGASTVEMLRAHYRQQLELRLQLGAGRPGAEDYVFPVFVDGDFAAYPPDRLSANWSNVVRDRKLPRVMFHALRHTHASMLIAEGIDVVSVSKRLGHSKPTITLSVYAHLFTTHDTRAAAAVDRLMGV